MKKMILVLSLLVSQLTLAQTAVNVNVNGTIQLGNGQSTVGISVGSSNATTNQLTQRVLLLEQAVRDLQIQVYNLTLNDLPTTADLFECSVSAFGKTYFGEGDTENLARSNARKACLAKESDMFCRDIKCSKLR
jgi:hypothetical protein